MRHISDNLKRIAGVKPTNKKNTFKASNTVSVNLKTAEEMYLDYFDNFLTVSNFADHYGLTVDQANAIIRLGRNVHINNN